VNLELPPFGGRDREHKVDDWNRPASLPYSPGTRLIDLGHLQHHDRGLEDDPTRVVSCDRITLLLRAMLYYSNLAEALGAC